MALEYCLQVGPFTVGLLSTMQAALKGIRQSYPDALKPYSGELVDFELAVQPPSFLRNWFRPSAQFYWDERAPFHPVPKHQAPLAFEWGLNFAIAKSANQYVLLHSAVLAKDGQAVIMPAPPGSGKSTLTAGLMLSGWQLLSDEFALFDIKSGDLVPLPRPISLKNRSIELIRQFSPERAELSERYPGTKKGDIALLQVDATSRAMADKPARLRWVILPRWQANSETLLTSFPKGQGLMVLADNAFNLGLHGAEGFNLLCDLLERADCYELTYSDLQQGIDVVEELASTC